MKITWTLKIELHELKIIGLQLIVVLFFWSCYCYQGDEAHPISVSHVSQITCHVIFENTHRRHVTKACSCKCSIWCRNTLRCSKLHLCTQTNFSLPQSIKRNPLSKFTVTACGICYEEESTSFILDDILFHTNFECHKTDSFYETPYCDNYSADNWCCSLYCSNEYYTGKCLYLYPKDLDFDSAKITQVKKNVYQTNRFPTNEITKYFLNRKKRNSESHLPYHFRVLNTQYEITNNHSSNTKSELNDILGAVIPDGGGNVKLPTAAHKRLIRGIKLEEFERFYPKRRHILPNISFKEHYNKQSLLVEPRDSPGVRSWTSERLTANYRPLTLRPSGRTLPISSKENDTLSPAAGVIIYDDMTNYPANKSYLSQYIWEGSISLLYNEIYPGQLIGTTFRVINDGSNEILFDDIVISHWGYSYILKVEIKTRTIPYWNLTCFIGPFDVDKFDTFEQPLVESDEFRSVKIVFDNTFEIAKRDGKKFEIFFLNSFGMKYPKVRWKNVSLSEGSIVVDSIITGLAEDLEKTSVELEAAIENDKANVIYEENILKANKMFLPSRKLLEESGSSTESSDEGGGLSVAWIVAIVVNVILILVFIIAIVYCYCRRKKKEENEDDPPGYPTPSPEPQFPTPKPSPEPEDYWRPDSYTQQEEEPEEEDEMFLPGAISEPSPDPPEEVPFYVYLLSDFEGSRELIGQIYLKVDTFLSDVRRAIDRNRDLSQLIGSREYRFLNENLDTIIYQESSLDLRRVFPSQAINIQYLPRKAPTPMLEPPSKPKVPAYVGPLGICNTSDCTKAAKIKCLDCRNVAYCTKRCMVADAKDHKRNCFKPAWRL